MSSIFGGNKKSKSPRPADGGSKAAAAPSPKQKQKGTPSSDQQPSSPSQPERPQLTFHCQQAHGSPTGIISGFSNVKELYEKIAECYDISSKEILFCTLNTHKIDMKMLLGGQIGLDDFIFAHVLGQAKELEVRKTGDALGLTITDNGAGYAFIKRIKDGSTASQIPHIKVGDHIQKVNGRNLVGCRHYEVAKLLKEIPKGELFSMRLVEPKTSGFSNIASKKSGGGGGNKAISSGKHTLRFKANEPARIEEVSDVRSAAEEKINTLLENFLGINDADLASQIFDLSESKENTMDFAEALDESDLSEFGFTDAFVFELWGAITDAKSGR